MKYICLALAFVFMCATSVRAQITTEQTQQIVVSCLRSISLVQWWKMIKYCFFCCCVKILLTNEPYSCSDNHLSESEILVIVAELNSGVSIEDVIQRHPKFYLLCKEYPELPVILSDITGIQIPVLPFIVS